MRSKKKKTNKTIHFKFLCTQMQSLFWTSLKTKSWNLRAAARRLTMHQSSPWSFSIYIRNISDAWTQWRDFVCVCELRMIILIADILTYAEGRKVKNLCTPSWIFNQTCTSLLQVFKSPTDFFLWVWGNSTFLKIELIYLSVFECVHAEPCVYSLSFCLLPVSSVCSHVYHPQH